MPAHNNRLQRTVMDKVPRHEGWRAAAEPRRYAAPFHSPGCKPVGEWLSEEAPMSTKHRKKLVHEGKYAAEVEVDLINDENGWGPYLSVADAQKLDHVREALRRGDIKSASQLARVFSLTPIAV